MEEHPILLDIHQHRQAIHQLRHLIRRLVHLTRQLVHHILQHLRRIHHRLRTTHQLHHHTSVRVVRNISVHRHIRQRHRATHRHLQNIHLRHLHIHRQVHLHLPAVHTIQLHPIIHRLAPTILLVHRPIHQVLQTLAAIYTVHQLFLRFHRATRRKVQQRIRQKEALIHQERHQHIHQQLRVCLQRIKHTAQPVQHIHQAVLHIVNKNSKMLYFVIICTFFEFEFLDYIMNVAKLAFTA